MKKLACYSEFEKGKIYNRVYIGPNEAYARVNGKETFQVREISPALVVDILFDQFGSVFTDDLRKSSLTFTHPEIAFKGFELYEPADESEWFKKSLKVTSLAEALQQGLSQKEIVNVRSSRFISMGDGGQYVGVYTTFYTEGSAVNPFLQSIYVVWENWEKLRADFKAYGIEV